MQVSFHEVGETADGDRYMIQEFIEGRTLRELAEDRLPLSRLLGIGARVARVLAAAHAAGIVHRDIKPDNVMVRADGYVKVLDFGIAVMAEPISSMLTETGTATGSLRIVGTPAYLSPEQALEKEIGPPSDIFSLGIVLYELASGRRPFGGPSALNIITRIASAEEVPLSRVTPDLPAQLTDLVQAMLDKVPERRPTASVVEATLVQCAAGALRVAAMGARSTATVGRDAPPARLHAAYDPVRDGIGVMIGITGEPGMGKSSLLDEFLGRWKDCPNARSPRVPVLGEACWHRGVPARSRVTRQPPFARRTDVVRGRAAHRGSNLVRPVTDDGDRDHDGWA